MILVAGSANLDFVVQAPRMKESPQLDAAGWFGCGMGHC